jgi:succinate-acetate transporter protein
MSEKPALANPAVVGLGGFGATTLLLQFHNLGWCSVGPVFALAMFFGGLAQFIAGFKEFKTGNNFGFAAFCTYGSFWLALGLIILDGKIKLFDITSTDTGWFLVIFTILTFIYLIGAMKQNTALSVIFITLFIGFVFLDISHLGGPSGFTTVAAIDLIVCALSAWYLMAHVIFEPLGINLPVGRAWIK